jgi:hypothetical protein
MLKRTRETVRAVAETLGAISPTLSDATAAAEEHRQSLIVAQNVREAAEQALQAAHDRGADDGEIVRLEAALAAAKVDESRAEARYRGAENRLQRASNADADKARAAAIVKRDIALATFNTSAAEIDRLAAEMAAHVQTIDAQYAAYAEAKRDHVAGDYSHTSGSAMAKLALERAMAAQAGEWTGNKPAAETLAGNVTGAILAVAA